MTSKLIEFNHQYADQYDAMHKCFTSKVNIMRAASAGRLNDRIEKELLPSVTKKFESFQSFSNEMKVKMLAEFENVERTIAKLHNEIQSIGALKLKVDPVKWLIVAMYPPIRIDDDQKVKDLIADCKKYHEAHQTITNY